MYVGPTGRGNGGERKGPWNAIELFKRVSERFVLRPAHLVTNFALPVARVSTGSVMIQVGGRHFCISVRQTDFSISRWGAARGLLVPAGKLVAISRAPADSGRIANKEDKSPGTILTVRIEGGVLLIETCSTVDAAIYWNYGIDSNTTKWFVPPGSDSGRFAAGHFSGKNIRRVARLFKHYLDYVNDVLHERLNGESATEKIPQLMRLLKKSATLGLTLPEENIVASLFQELWLELSPVLIKLSGFSPASCSSLNVSILTGEEALQPGDIIVPNDRILEPGIIVAADSEAETFTCLFPAKKALGVYETCEIRQETIMKGIDKYLILRQSTEHLSANTEALGRVVHDMVAALKASNADLVGDGIDFVANDTPLLMVPVPLDAFGEISAAASDEFMATVYFTFIHNRFCLEAIGNTSGRAIPPATLFRLVAAALAL